MGVNCKGTNITRVKELFTPVVPEDTQKIRNFLRGGTGTVITRSCTEKYVNKSLLDVGKIVVTGEMVAPKID